MLTKQQLEESLFCSAITASLQIHISHFTILGSSAPQTRASNLILQTLIVSRLIVIALAEVYILPCRRDFGYASMPVRRLFIGLCRAQHQRFVKWATDELQTYR